MTLALRVAAALFTTIALSSHVAHAQEEPAEPTSYAPLIEAAVAEFGAGRFAEARALFRGAHDLYPNARTLRGIGMSSFELRDYPGAVRALSASLEETRRALTDEQRTQVNDLLLRARAFVGRFVVPIAPAGSRLYLDGTGVEVQGGWPEQEGELLVGVGDHEVTIRAPEGRSAHARLVVRGREDEPLDIDTSPLAPPPREEPTPPRAEPESVPLVPPPPAYEPREEASDPAPWILAGAGGAAIVTGAILLGVGLHDISVVENAPMGDDWSALRDAYDRAPVLTGTGIALIGIGSAAAVVGIVWGSLDTSRPQAGARTALRVGPGTIAVQGSF
ncbi:hypothetical protein [Sandaracinus amylolyticus]|uniref:hypothetical protein n=1 Tax=Sandaracinus amylolyticus TaxID=927083 RepID=UPI001F3FF18F|nr:hypothetical protein [Sandaracinus amylolyticus]UJR86621.1 Hypothetical protein I5071_87220 [Sandaracinus amylolyticus]